ncbi:MAG: hypothetical protein M3N43_02160 [Actinomycetota bacterium]|nr:hypothetical protein [Actinomycetota bacterium]
MSIFDFPRINIVGTIQLNPGTANNDDYAQQATMPASWGPFAGAPLALINSRKVEARRYGMTDADFVAWAQQEHSFDGSASKIIPAEWNYYGDMSSTIDASMGTKVIGVQVGASGVASADCMGAALTLSGGITDINPEGSPPATQFFIDELTLTLGGKTLIRGRLSKAVGQWINFYRNVNVVADGGAGAYIYQPFPDAEINLAGWDPAATGFIFRYYLFNAHLANPGTGSTNAEIEALYKAQKINPKDLQIVGTIVPLYPSERIVSVPTGRLLVSNTPNVPTPPGSQNNGNGMVSLGPAVIAQRDQTLSADFSGTFPDYAQSGSNPKYDFGPVELAVVKGTSRVVIGPVDYADTNAGDARGWLFDFDLSNNQAALDLLADDGASLQLQNRLFGNVLGETDYYFVSNQQAVYGEQHGSKRLFLNRGTQEPITVAVYRRGRELTGAERPTMTVWQYRAVPLQAPGDALPISTNFRPGDSLVVDTSKAGNRLFTFTINGPDNPPPAGYPPKSYLSFMNPPFVTNAPQISLRVLPNDEDFSEYYVDPCAEHPIGNARLNFDVVYAKVLRTYFLLYPAMNGVFALNDPKAVRPMAKKILARTNLDLWLSTNYMPRTRDLSESRRTLLQAWCRKVLAKPQ